MMKNVSLFNKEMIFYYTNSLYFEKYINIYIIYRTIFTKNKLKPVFNYTIINIIFQSVPHINRFNVL